MAGCSLNLEHHLNGVVSRQISVKVKGMESSVDGGSVHRKPHGAKRSKSPVNTYVLAVEWEGSCG